MNNFNMLFLSSEVRPFVNGGGLSEISASLPKALKEKGLNVKVITPLYTEIDYQKHKLTKIMDNCSVKMGNCNEFYSVHYSKAYGVDVYFIEFQKYFDRASTYGDQNGEYYDNAFRFTFFCRAAMQLSKDLHYWPSIVHSNDWQTAFVNYAIKRSWDPFWQGVKTVFSIHNMGYQGIFSGDVLPYAGVDMKDWNADGLECYHNINLLKTGIVYADKVSTVSPNYAKEILSPRFGEGLDYYLNKRAWDLIGVLNGVDIESWNPETDKNLIKNYNVKNFKAGKKACKKELQKRFHLEQRSDVPLFCFTARLASQKGIHMLAETIRPMVENIDMQFVLIGAVNNGEEWAGSFFGDLPKYYSGKIGAYIGYSNDMAKQVMAGSDFYFMPSLYEPCGLNQMQAQRYGALPIVTGVGGLDDTVENYDEKNGTGTGFKFYYQTADALYNTAAWAAFTYYDKPKDIDNMIKQSMTKDISWNKSCDEYIQIYNWAMWG